MAKRYVVTVFFCIQLASFLVVNCQHPNLIFLDENSLKDSILTTLRDETTPCAEFQDATDQIAAFLAIEAGKFLLTEKKEVNTPMGVAFAGVTLKKNILVPVLRSGLSLLPIFQKFYKGATVGMVGIKRDEETAEPMLYYSNLPKIKKDDHIIVLEPMLATGGSLSMTVALLKKAGAAEENIIIATVVAVMEGIERIHKNFPKVRIILAALDPHMNETWYIVPGLGDFGDRYFGNDSEPHFQMLQV